MNKITEFLKQIVSDPNRIITENIEAKYLSDSLGRKQGTAQVLVFVISTEEVSTILRYAYENRIPVTPRGAGTNLVGSTVPFGNGIVLDFTHMNHILEVDEETFTATVEPGVVLSDFQSFVEQKGLFYPPDPGEKKATIGGNISTNAGGMRAVKYGVTRDYVMGLELVLSDGTVITVGSKNRKDTSGLDLKELVIGSEGTVAIITKAILKLIPKPEKTLSVLVGFDSLKYGIEAVPKIIKANLNPTAIEFVQQKVVRTGEQFLNLQFPSSQALAYLLMTFDGSQEEITSNIVKLKKMKENIGAISVLELKVQKIAEDVWKIRGVLVKAVEAESEQEPLDIVVPINQIDRFVGFVSELEENYHIRIVTFGHAGDGNVHLCILRGDRSDEQWEKDLDKILDILYEKAYELGGLASGEHGLGTAKRKYFFRKTEKKNVALMNRVKNAFDERHILNEEISYIS